MVPGYGYLLLLIYKRILGSTTHHSEIIAGLVRSYLALSKTKEALHAAREAMKAMPQSAKALKLVGDVHASNTSGREKVVELKDDSLVSL